MGGARADHQGRRDGLTRAPGGASLGATMPPRPRPAAPVNPLHAVVTQMLASSLGDLTGDGELGAVKDGLRALAKRDPMDTVVTTVLTCTVLFYNAERGVNPKVKTPADALLYITTCMSVGYADVFARTTAGKLIASYVMTVGPAMSAKVLEAPAADARRAEDEQRDFQKALLEKLDTLTAELRARPTTPRAG